MKLVPAHTPFRILNPVFGPPGDREMAELCRRYGPHGMYSEEGESELLGGLPQRYDAARNYLGSGLGRSGEDLRSLVARTNYFRETYAYGNELRLPGIEPFLRFEGFIEAARAVHGRPLIEPAIVFANLYVPGQELAIHTDVPEFRGANRKKFPQWLLVVMRHSGLFEDVRLRIATAVSWYGASDGGEFIFYPDGATGAPGVIPARFDTAIVTDTDTAFHGVLRVAADHAEAPPLSPGMRLCPAENDSWIVLQGDTEVARYSWDQLRFSVSWKAYCFSDDAERQAVRHPSNELTPARALEVLERDLHEKGALSGERPEIHELANLLLDTYVQFPEAAGMTGVAKEAE